MNQATPRSMENMDLMDENSASPVYFRYYECLSDEGGVGRSMENFPKPQPSFSAPPSCCSNDSDHKAVLLAVVRHEDDVAVRGPDEAGQLQGVLGAGGGRLDRWYLVGLDAAELGGRV